MIRSFCFGENGQLKKDVPISDYGSIIESGQGLLWVDIEAITGMDAQQVLAGIFKLHPQVVEDCMQPLQYSHMSLYRDHLFLAAHGLKISEGLNKVKIVELDMVLGRNFLISVHAELIPQIETAIKNLTEGPPVIPQRGMDWLAYQIMDHTVDSYLPVIDLLSDRMEQLENEALEKPEPAILAQILAAKRDIVTVHRAVLPLRELVSRLGRERFEQIDSSTQSSFRDAYDHMVRVSSASEVLREVAEGALTIYAMSQNNRTNEIIKALSIAATVGLPAIIIASIYGMNFRNMPELQWRYGYLFAVLTMVAVSAVLFLFFRGKKWL